MSAPELSVVIPLYNEAGVAAELARRLKEASARLALECEIIFVDDASTDGTAGLLRGTSCVEVLSLDENRGQFGATCAGLAVAQGRLVAVLDGDLQDPPELLPELVGAIGQGELAFAVKVSRQDPLWFRLGRLGYRALARLGKGVPPSGAGSYCVMRRGLAERVASSGHRAANLSAVVVTLAETRGPWPLVNYEKAARYDGRSRVGLYGLVQEALGSLWVTGALTRLGVLTGLALLPLALWLLG